MAIMLRRDRHARNSFAHFPAFYNRLPPFVLGLASPTTRRRQHRTRNPDNHASFTTSFGQISYCPDV